MDRLRDEGPVAGMEGWTLKHVADPTYCTGIKVVTVRGKRKIAPDDKPLADVYALVFPTNLSFDPANKTASEVSRKKFNDWVQTMQTTSQDATKAYTVTIKSGIAVAEWVRAAARSAQVEYRVASILARAPIPKDIRTGDYKEGKMKAYCDKMLEVAEPMILGAEADVAACAEKLGDSTDWPASVCKP